jgi:uncharacterized membrane protein
MLGAMHVVLAITALVAGGAMFLQKKGGRLHRSLGYLYCVALLLVNVSALLVYQDNGGPGPFHILALISLATLSAGFVPAFTRADKSGWLHRHAYFMSWSYVGLVAAGVGQMAIKWTDLPAAIAVGLLSTLVVLLGGYMTHRLVPESLMALYARTVGGEGRP